MGSRHRLAVTKGRYLRLNTVKLTMCRRIGQKQEIATNMLDVTPIPAFSDNYLWLMRGIEQPQLAVVVDPGDAQPVIDHLAQNQLSLAAILVTHHHNDHVGGVSDLLNQYPVPVYGPQAERIPGMIHPLAEGDRVTIPGVGLQFTVLDLPGHTAGHIAYYGHGAIFCGDTLFCAGCGRLFEGTPAQMSASLAKLAALAPDTQVYCTHEYTLDNLRFAAQVEPENPALIEFRQAAEQLRDEGLPTLPSTIGRELSLNPFLRCAEDSVRRAANAHAGHELAGPVEVFAEIRHWKDGFA